MRLVAKFCAMLVGGLVLVLAAAGWLQVHRDLVLFERDTALDQEATARVLRSALEAVAETGGIERAQRVVELANRRQHRVTLRWVPLDELPPAVAGRLRAEERARLLGGHPVRAQFRKDLHHLGLSGFLEGLMHNQKGFLDLPQVTLQRLKAAFLPQPGPNHRPDRLNFLTLARKSPMDNADKLV